MRLQILSCHPDAGRARTGVLALAAALALAACSGGSDEVSGGSQPQAAGAPSPTVEPEPTPTPMSTCDVQEFLTASNALGQDMLVAQEQISSYVPLLIEGLAAGASGNTVLLDAKLEQIKAAMTPPSAAAIASEYAAARELCTGVDAARALAPAGCDVGSLVTAADAVANQTKTVRGAGAEYEQVIRDAVKAGTNIGPEVIASLGERADAIKNRVISDESLTVAANYTSARDACAS